MMNYADPNMRNSIVQALMAQQNSAPPNLAQAPAPMSGGYRPTPAPGPGGIVPSALGSGAPPPPSTLGTASTPSTPPPPSLGDGQFPPSQMSGPTPPMGGVPQSPGMPGRQIPSAGGGGIDPNILAQLTGVRS